MPELTGPSNAMIMSMRHIVKYPDCNATDNLFGGQMMAWIDEGAALYASCQMKTSRLVTRLFGAVEFRVPVPRGSVCTVYTGTAQTGKTSLKVHVKVTTNDFGAGADSEKVVCETDLVFVAVDENGKSTPWRKP